MKRQDLYKHLRDNQISFSDPTCCTKLLNFLSPSQSCESAVKMEVHRFLAKLKEKWQASSRKAERFEESNKSWLEGEFGCIQSEKSKVVPVCSVGRPTLSFAESSDRSKRRKSSEIASSYSSTELLHAASIGLRAEGKSSLAQKTASIMRDDNREKSEYTPNEALILLIDARLTKSSYQLLRSSAGAKGHNIYPSYNDVRKAKESCYPYEISVEEFKVEIPVQSLLNHTIERLCTVQKSVLNNNFDAINNLTMYYKWGFDGATGQSLYKQISSEKERNLSQEENIFITSVVPLELRNEEKIYWKNSKPSSTVYCRPIRFQFLKESVDCIKQEQQYIQSQINALEPTIITLQSENNLTKTVQVNHVLYLTMIDGKVHNALSEVTNSSQCCSLCGATPKMMNEYENMINSNNFTSQQLSYGISTLHAWIRFFECLLHIAYRLPFKTWSARGNVNQDIMKKEKTRIQEEFKNRMGLIVDRPKAGGSGTTNDGNTARRAFQDPKTTSTILNIKQELIEHFHTILATLSCGFNVDPQKFKLFCLSTAKLYVDEYPWFNMPQSIHKILIHGYLVIDNISLPIGMMSEEASEARNKDFKKYRENFARKCSRTKTNHDLVNRLLVSSDPLISSGRTMQTQKNAKFLPTSVLQLLTGEVHKLPVADFPETCL